MIRAALDSGSARLGLVIAYVDVATPGAILALVVPPETIDVGRKVPLAVPEIRTWKDGSIHEYTYRHEVNADDEEIAALAVVDRLVAAGVAELVIEQARGFHVSDGTSKAGASAQGSALLIQERIGTKVAEKAKAIGILVVFVAMATWRARVVGKAHARDVEVAPAIVAGYVDWPEASTKDERDAAGALLWSTLPPAEKKRRASRGKRRRRTEAELEAARQPRLTAWQRQQIANRAAREGAGCACPPRGRHRRECPVAVAASAARRAESARRVAELLAAKGVAA